MCETENSPLSGAKVKNAWSYISSPSYDFMVFTEMTLHTYIHTYIHLCSFRSKFPVIKFESHSCLGAVRCTVQSCYTFPVVIY